MYRQEYQDYKYVMQDTYLLYVGAKYTFEELVENEDAPFKFRLIVERYIYPEVSPEDTLESHLYYLTNKMFPYRIYRQLKAKVKVSVLEDKKTLFGRSKKEYVNRTVTMDQLVKMPLAEKEERGVVIQELILGKLAVMSF